VSAHRVIVAVGSPVFHAMLYGNMKKSSQKEIELPSIDSNLLKKLFHFIYTGHVQKSFSKCFDLLLVADYFDVGTLTTVCVHIIEEHLTNDNVGNVITFAIKHQFNSLLATCKDFMEDYAHGIVCSNFCFFSKPLPVAAVIEVFEVL